ncbi:phosphate/phosphite/phosphonate ABC transporter substrate-binding protein [Paeniglutamicibacter gangotriensis]|uniref:Phosphate/phosphite/phosphonate ABC transporter substrate-binding protein n=1 Tax=Paeniglutamicibacter gangotriensis TaxID=254787 RepID=A0A5B0EIH6_9MICC|nr:phosphate/phosphite/phosphonate ABC transporter substrate-binding protein [Paeniglutamicibacter gangotriensis]KAA0977651.1 phosphate/phosphite/phosphonate ABC transporter substrate-binding protein [Paeniglutamicibacter gangotriensis]
MNTRRILGLGALSLAGLLAITGCSSSASADSAEADVIRIATLPTGDDPTVVNPIVALGEIITAETGMTVEITDAPDYLGVVEAVRADHVDIALMSAFPSALAVNTGEVDALMTWPGSPDPVSKCYVLADSPIQSVEELKGTTVAFADPGSSSGFFMPVHLLDSVGLKRDVDYEAMFTGGHDRSAIAVKEGQVDAACTATMLTQMTCTDYFPFEDGDVRFIGESIGIDVSMAVIASQGMSDEKRNALLSALPTVFSEKNAEVLGVYAEAGIVGVDPILEPSREAFQSLVDVAAVADVDISDLK